MTERGAIKVRLKDEKTMRWSSKGRIGRIWVNCGPPRHEVDSLELDGGNVEGWSGFLMISSLVSIVPFVLRMEHRFVVHSTVYYLANGLN
jgi:hypothetical protein